MKKLFVGVVALAVAAAIGCDNGKPAGGPGAPGASKSATGTTSDHATNKADTFTLKMPGTTDMKQGETKDVHVAINRGKDFKQKVSLKFDPPKGVTVEPKEAPMPTDANDMVVKVKAADDAAVGEQVVNVSATPETGTAVTGTFKLKVDKMTK